MKKIKIFIATLFCFLLCTVFASADEAIEARDITYMNGSWYYWNDSDIFNPLIFEHNAKTGEEKVFSKKCILDNEGNYINFAAITNDGKNLIAIDTYRNHILSLEEDGAKILFSFTEDFRFEDPNIAVCGKYLFVNTSRKNELFRFDMSNGESKRLSINNVMNIFAMKDGTLLIHQGIIELSPDNLKLIDPDTCEIKSVIAEFEGRSNPVVAVDMDTEKIYAAFNAGIWTLEHNKWVKVRSVQLSNSNLSYKSKANCSAQFFYMYNEEYGNRKWRIINLNEDIELTSIIVGGFYTMGDLDMPYMQEHPNHVVIKELSLKTLSALDLYTRLLAKDDRYDIYAIMFNDGVVKLIRQELFLSLNGEAFDTYREALYPNIAESVCVNQLLYGIFDNVNILNFEVKPNQGVETPRSIEELIELLEHWDEHPANRGQELLVINGNYTMDNETLLLLCLKQLIYHHVSGQMLWENPKVISLLERIRDAKLQPQKELTMEIANNAVMKFVGSSIWLSDDCGMQALPLLVDDVPMLVPMNSVVLLLNPYAKHTNEAKEYLAYLCANTNVGKQRALFSTMESRLMDEYLKDIERLEKEKEQTDLKIKKQELDAEIESIRNDPRSYTASPKALATYREKIVPQLLTAIPQLLSDNSSMSIEDFLNTQVNSFLNHQLSTEQLIISIRRWIDMSLKEEQ